MVRLQWLILAKRVRLITGYPSEAAPPTMIGRV